jgi:hypothetical protein
LRNLSWGRYFPSTTRHTVSGVARSRPIGPQSQVQKKAARRIANGATPVLMP